MSTDKVLPCVHVSVILRLARNCHSACLTERQLSNVFVMNTPGEKGVDSSTERGRCLFRLRRRQESWSRAGNGHTHVGKQAGESKLRLKAITGSHKRARKRFSICLSTHQLTTAAATEYVPVENMFMTAVSNRSSGEISV